MSRLFLSCVTREFRAYRELLTSDLRRAGIDVRVQESFSVGGGTLLDALDDYIRECDAVVHLIGHGTGAIPKVHAVRTLLDRYPDMPSKLPVLTDALSQPDPRISYTQWEAWLAIYHARKTHIYVASDAAPRGVGFVANDDEKRSQEGHFKRICELDRHRGSFENEERLSTYVLGDLRQLFHPDEPFKAEPSHLWKLQTKPDSVFEGREQVLKDLDELWADSLAEKPGRAQIISLVAIGGAGKTTVASRWKDALLSREDHCGVERYFDWSFYSQGTRGSDTNTGTQTEADATVFVAAALKFFEDPVMADSAAPAWDKGARLAALVAKHRTLLILDGLEPLQHPPGPQTGELKDDAIRALFAGLQSSARGLCLITTREPVSDLAITRETTTPERLLDHLTDVDGAAVLRSHGVIGPQSELEAVSREVKGHALTLSLMGRYLRLAFDPPDIARRDCFDFTDADAETKNGHAFRVFAAYERWFESEQRYIELAVLRLLGLFDRPASPDCIAAICTKPAIPSLTEPLVNLAEQQWNAAIQRLRELDLIETSEWVPKKVIGFDEKKARAEMEAGQRGRATNLGPAQPFELHLLNTILRASLDAHPLLREYFGAQLAKRGIASAAHARLYTHLCASVPYWPEGRDGILPLFQAINHGCKAGYFRDALRQVYIARILRGMVGTYSNYCNAKLGLFGLSLAAVACFFLEPWSRLAEELDDGERGWLLAVAGYSLRALNRLDEARDPMRVAIELAVEQGDWHNAAIYAGNLSELELTLGYVIAAEMTAMKSVNFADRSGNAFERMGRRATHAGALHCMGRLESSRALFSEAEAIQADRQAHFPLLYALQGFLYFDLLLAPAERKAWQRFAEIQVRVQLASSESTIGTSEESVEILSIPSDFDAIQRRAQKMFEWRVPGDSLLTIALDNLTLGRLHLIRAAFQDSKDGYMTPTLLQACEHLNIALVTLRESNTSDHMPLAILSSAWLHLLLGERNVARQRLDEAFAIATRGSKVKNGWIGGMRLHLIDTLLHRARLFGRLDGEYPWKGRTPKADLDEAAALIDACGYHRRDEELADARAIFG